MSYEKQRKLLYPTLEPIPERFIAGKDHPPRAYFDQDRLSAGALRILLNKEREQSRYDPKFPNFLNGQVWHDDIEHRIGEGKAFGIIFIDFDNFKRVNDELGHDVGDEIIMGFGRILSERFQRRTDAFSHVPVTESTLISRYGGDEFGITIDLSQNHNRGTDPYERMAQAQLYFYKVWHDFIDSRGNRATLRDMGFGISLGAVVFDPEAPETATEIIIRADKLMYEAKMSKKGSVETPSQE